MQSSSDMPTKRGGGSWKATNKTQYVWLFRNQNHAFFTIEDTRSSAVAERILGESAGVLVADDYAGFNAVVKENSLTRVQYWGHTRRKFYEIRETYPGVDVFLDLVGDLYRKDRELRKSGSTSAMYRRRLCRPVFKAIDKWR